MIKQQRFALSIGLVVASTFSATAAPDPAAVPIDADDIGGVVTGARGPEAGVWVIAETTGLPTKFTRIVVTDDQGRYVIPDLPKASYNVWARGYGLVDSAQSTALPGNTVNIKAIAAPDATTAAQYYPAIYWYSMLKIPAKNEFPLGEAKDQGQWLDVVKTDGCITCHQLGNRATRTIPETFKTVGTSTEIWERRIMSGQAGMSMASSIGRVDTARAIGLFADWTDRIAKGELPHAKPERPQGLERNVVVTLWDWSSPTAYLHDAIATDKRNPTVNGYGQIYGATELSTDMIPVLDPVKHTATMIKAPVRDGTPTAKDDPVVAPSHYWGEEVIWDSHANLHNPMIDGGGRVWFTHRIRAPENPAFCKAGSDHPSAKAFPTERTGRHLSVYDPKTQKFSLIDTCFSTHHLQFAADANNTLWTSGGGQVIGWLNSKMFLETGDAVKSQGWTPMIVDTNGNGKRDAYVEPNQPVDPTKDKRVVAGFYGVAPNPADGSIWGSSLGYPGAIVRLDPGANPATTALTEIYTLPAPGYSPRGMDIDKNGVVWAPLASGHFAKFDRRKCKGPLNGPAAATGKLCPEGWTLYPFPGPQFASLSESGSAEASYYSWVDQWNTLGMGENVAIATGNLSDSLIVMVNDKPIQLRVPYPLGFYNKGLDGRIDDPKAGWKGRGLWTTTGNRTPFHSEGGKGAKPKVAHFQMRPDPLAR